MNVLVNKSEVRLTRFGVWLCTWVDLLCNVIGLLTFLYWRPGWYIQLSYWLILRHREEIEREFK